MLYFMVNTNTGQRRIVNISEISNIFEGRINIEVLQIFKPKQIITENNGDRIILQRKDQ